MSFRKKQSAWKRFVPFAALAVLVHLALLPLVPSLPTPGAIDKANRPIEVALVPTKQTLNARKTKKKRKVVAKKAVKKEKMPIGQIVNLPSTPDAEEPDEADYLAKTNSKTEKQTKSRHRTTQYKNPGNELSKASKNADQEKSSVASKLGLKVIAPKGSTKNGKSKNDQRTGRFELPSMKLKDALQLEIDPDFGKLVNRRSQSKIDGNGQALRLYKGDGVERGDGADAAQSQAAGTNLPDLIPSMGVLAKLDAAPASDHLKDVEEGEGTFLNAKRFKYASFFNRVHKGVSNAWQPLKELRRRDPRGQVYGRATRTTLLNVTLNAEGAITDVGIVRSSGLDFLDQEAIYAFQRAQPFPNPPVGLLENNAINFRFGFNLNLSPRGPFEPRF